VSHGTSRPQPEPAWSRRWCAAALVAVSIAWSLQYPFWPNRDRLLDQGKIVDYHWLAFVLWAFGMVLWVWALWRLLPSLKGRSFGQEVILVVTTSVAMLTAFVAMYPTNAIDVYIYAARSRLLTKYGENPNSVQPIVHWDTDPYMHFASKEWSDNLSPYGPLWNQLAAPVTWIGGDSVAAAVIGFKLLSVISAIVIAALVYDIVRLRSPDWALPATLFWLWNPLVLWDGVGNGHNDVTLMLPVLAAIWAWQRRHDAWVVPLLVASVLIKYVTVILIPVAIFALWRRNPTARERIRGIAVSAVSIAVLGAASLYPFFDVDAVRESAVEQGAKVSSSPAWAVMASLHEWSRSEVDAETIQRIAYAIVAGVIAAWALACWRLPNRLPRAAFEVMFAFMLIASTNQRAWYVIWLVPLAALLIPDTPWRRALTWSVSSMCGHACTIWLWYVWDFDAWGYYWYIMIIIAVVFVPVLAVTTVELRDTIRSRLLPARATHPQLDQTSPR